VDSEGLTLEFLLSSTRAAAAAKQFFCKALLAAVAPRLITVEKNAAYPKAFQELKAEGLCSKTEHLRQVKYRNNLVEQDQRFIKRLVKPGLGFFSCERAWRTLQGDEVRHMLRKGQMKGVDKGDSRQQVRFIASLFGVAA
jgi:IS6 family transposase